MAAGIICSGEVLNKKKLFQLRTNLRLLPSGETLCSLTRCAWFDSHRHNFFLATQAGGIEARPFFLILKDFIEISNTRYRNEAVVAPMYAL